MAPSLLDALLSNPVIAAVKNDDGLELALQSDCEAVFVLYGDICNVRDIATRVKSAGKFAVLHMDLIDGLAAREISVDFIKRQTCADGIISTKPALLRRAKELGLIAVFRCFLIDSKAFDTLHKQLDGSNPDFVEILPGMLPKVMRRLAETTSIPLIAGGLIGEREDVLAALDAGATAISATSPDVWKM